MANCEVHPISAFQSTNLNSKINTFGDLGDRILRTLGYPFVNVEIHRDSLYENISIAVEMFTKFAGYTQEYLLFDSDLYDLNHGIRLDHLFTLHGDESLQDRIDHKTDSQDFSTYLEQSNTVYISMSAIPGSYFSDLSGLSAYFTNGAFLDQIIPETIYNMLTAGTGFTTISSYLEQNKEIYDTVKGTQNDTSRTKLMGSFDYDAMDYRKVIAVTDFEEGSTTGINTLFTIEQTLAQQTYFSYAMGNYGFDLISWYVLKDWLENREKLLATKRSYTFDERTQILRMYPQPRSSGYSSRFYGVVSCYVERPIRDVIKEQWVYQYALALTKMTVALIRGKYGTVTLFGGGSLNATDLMTQGLAEKEKLETKLYEGAPGLGDNDPPLFFVG